MPKLKLLPWLAHRHGVPLGRAEELWRQAVALASFNLGADAHSSDYWAYAMRTLLKLLRCDGAAVVHAAATEQPCVLLARRSTLPLIASQRRLGFAAFDAAEELLHAANEYWSRALDVVNARR
jgi:hypothetical protein